MMINTVVFKFEKVLITDHLATSQLNLLCLMVCLINDLVNSFKESNLLTMLLVFKCNIEKLSLRFAL